MVKSLIKNLFALPMIWNGPAVMLRPAGVYVLMYHRIDDSQAGFHGLGKQRFESQLAWLERNCTLIDPDELPRYLEAPPRRKPAVLLTFDDGYHCVHDIVAPALRKIGRRGLVFLPTQIIDEGSLVWTDRLNWAFLRTRRESVRFPWQEECEYPLGSDKDRRSALQACKRHLKQLANTARLADEHKVMQVLGLLEASRKLPRQMLNWDEIRETRDTIVYGGHTHTHPIMSSLGEAEQEGEIATCQNRITAELGEASSYFAYPNGRATDFNEDSKRLLAKHGFNTAFTTEEGVATRRDDRLSIRRLPTTADRIADFAWLISRRG